jgi:hypothetical protein
MMFHDILDGAASRLSLAQPDRIGWLITAKTGTAFGDMVEPTKQHPTVAFSMETQILNLTRPGNLGHIGAIFIRQYRLIAPCTKTDRLDDHLSLTHM